MGVWISDAERPGEGVLTVEPADSGAVLSISLRSLLIRAGEYLGPDGKWTKTPYFFQLRRLEGDGPPRYRIGPDIVNHALAFDRIEIAREGDGEPLGAIDWPELPPAPRGATSRHSVYQPPRRPGKPAPPEPAPRAADRDDLPHPVEPKGGEQKTAEPARREPPPRQDASSKPGKEAPPPARRRRWGRGAALLAVLALAFAAVVEPCALLDVSCPAPPEDPEDRPADPPPRERDHSRDEPRDEAPPPAVNSIPDGVYNGYLEAACGEGHQTIPVAVKGNRITWTHLMKGILNHWEGHITSQGDIDARVANRPNTHATGRYSGPRHYIEMRYPECSRMVIILLGRRPV